MDSSDLNVVLISNRLEHVHFFSELGQFDMDRSTKSSSKVSWARGDVTKMFVVSELGDLLDLSCSDCESAEDGANIGTLLHRNDSKLVLLINPDEEGLLIVMENTSAVRPVTV